MRSWVSACVACSLVACGPKPEAKAPPPTPVAAAPVAVVEEAPDLSPVARPAEIIVEGRLAKPREFVETLTKWSSLPLGVDDLLPARMRGLARVVLWDAPVEMLVALDPTGEGKVPPPLVIGSIGVKSLDEALSAAEALQLPTSKFAPGIYRVGEFPNASCAIAVSVGTAPARLLCGRGTKDLDALLPYATRGLPNEARTGADFEVTLDAKPIQAHYGHDVTALRLFAGIAQREIALDSAKFDRALQDAIYGGVDEVINLFNDLDQLRVEARLDNGRNVLTASTELRLHGNSSWVAGTIDALKPSAIPTTLPRIPPGATLVGYNTTLPAERYAPLARVAGELLEGFLEHENLPEGTRKRARHLVDAWLSKLPEAFGFALGPSQSAPDGYLHPDTMVTRLSEPSPRILGAYGDFFGLLGDPALKRWLKQKLGVENAAEERIWAKAWPKVSKKPLKLVGFKTPGTLFEATADFSAWGEARSQISKMIENILPVPDAKQIGHIAILIQPDGDATYVVTGDDPTEMARVIAEHRKGEPGAPFVKPAHSDKLIAGGYLTLGYAAHQLARSAKNPELSKAVAGAPAHGQTPIPFSTSVGPGSARFDIELPAAVLSDASAAVVAAGPALKSAIQKR